MAKTKLKYLTTSDLFSIHFVPTLIVFLVMMILIGFSWRTASEAIIDSQNDQVTMRSLFVEANITQRFDIYDNALRGGAGLFESSNEVTREDWTRYVSSLDIPQTLPAMLGFGYSELIPAADLPAYVTRMRESGYPNFNLKSAGPARELYSSVTYIEPDTERSRQVIGGDMLIEENRREAMDRARDSGLTSMTDIVSMLQDDGSRQNGITIFHPVYRTGAPINTVEERRQAIIGFVYAPLRSDAMFGDIFMDNDTNFNIQVFDGDQHNSDTLLYQRYPTDEGEPYNVVVERHVQIGDQDWTIQYGARKGIVPEAVRSRPNNLALGGTIFALLVAGLVYLLLQRRSRQLAANENRKLESAKDNMLSLASHQLRTPATGVKQYLGMVLEGFVGDITDDQKELLQKANDSNERQLRIINEFLYLAKADAERIVISPQKFDLGELTHKVVADMQTDILEAGHEVRLKQRTKTVNVFADVHSARMIIENLISNALKYTPAGGKIIITISKHTNSSSVSVEDNGVGIAKKDFIKLFKQFSRIPNELTRQESGSGIGLYLANYLAEINGGKITVESKRHVGSTFTVYLPTKAVKKVTAT